MSSLPTLSTSVDLRTVYAFAREFHQKSTNFGKFSYGELANLVNLERVLMSFWPF